MKLKPAVNREDVTKLLRLRRFYKLVQLTLLAVTAILARQTWTYFTSPTILATARVPAVIVNGRITQLATADYLTVPGGVTTNGTAPTGAGDIETTSIHSGEIDATGTVTATATSGTVNNWDPSGVGSLSGLFIARESPSAALTLTGMIAPSSTQLFVIRNTSTTAADTIAINNENAGSTAANRFTLPNAASCSIPAGASATFRYSSTATRWEPIDNGCQQTLTTVQNATITVTDTGTQDNYNPTGLTSATIIRGNNASALTIDGIVGGQDARVLFICATNSAGNITLANEAAGSTAANRLWLTNNQNIQLIASTNANACAEIMYDATSSRWRLLSYVSSTVITTMQFSNGVTLAGGATVSAGQLIVSSANANPLLLSTATGHVSVVGATAPTLTSCGSGPTIHGSDVAGKFTTGTGATACTLTFGATYTNPAGCVLYVEGGTTLPTCTESATAITCSTAAASTTYDYVCFKVQ